MYCNRCDSEIPRWTNVCPKCGYVYPDKDATVSVYGSNVEQNRTRKKQETKPDNGGAADRRNSENRSSTPALQYSDNMLDPEELQRGQALYVKEAKALRTRQHVLLMLFSFAIALLIAIIAWEILTLYEINSPQNLSFGNSSVLLLSGRIIAALVHSNRT